MLNRSLEIWTCDATSRRCLPLNASAKARFAQLVLPRLDEGFRLARWLTGSVTDAEDVMQEACLRAYRSIETYVEGNTRAWFLTIVRNAAYSWIEKNRPDRLMSIEDLSEETRLKIDTTTSIASTVPTPEEALLVKAQASMLQHAIDRLPVHLKETFVLREYHGLTYREIAEVSSLPIGTVMSRLSKARQVLLSQIEEGSR